MSVDVLASAQAKKFPPPTEGPEDGVLEERVYKIEDDGIQSSKVALVANGEKKRWIVATDGIQVEFRCKMSLLVAERT